MVGILVGNLVLPLGQGIERRLNPWTLETILMSGVNTSTFVLGTVLWGYILSSLLFIPQAFFGIYFFGAHLDVNPVSLLVAIATSSLIVFSLSIISTGVRMVTKVTDPVTWSLGVLQALLAGMTFPVQYLDTYLPGLSSISWILPQTWIYHVVRLSTLEAGSLLTPDVAFSFLVTLAYALVLIPLALSVYRWGLRRAKSDGTLGWY